MHAVVLTDQAEIALEERPEPVAREGGVLIQVGAAGICGTDLHAPARPAIFASNVVLGHEFSGTVVCAGAGVSGFEPGQPVVVNPIALSCGSCRACQHGLSNQCLTALAQTSGVARDGGMAEFVTASQRSLHLVPDRLAVRDGAWTEAGRRRWSSAPSTATTGSSPARSGFSPGDSSMCGRPPRISCRSAVTAGRSHRCVILSKR